MIDLSKARDMYLLRQIIGRKDAYREAAWQEWNLPASVTYYTGSTPPPVAVEHFINGLSNDPMFTSTGPRPVAWGDFKP